MARIKKTAFLPFLLVAFCLTVTNFLLVSDESLGFNRESEILLSFTSRPPKALPERTPDEKQVVKIIEPEVTSKSWTPEGYEDMANATRGQALVECLTTELGTSILYFAEDDQMEEKLNNSKPVRKEVVNAVRRATPMSTIIDGDVTLVTIARVSELDKLVSLTKYWKGPVSVAIYFINKEDRTYFARFYDEHSCSFQKTTFHFFLEENSPPNSLLPTGKLLNLAFTNIDTGYLINIDINYIPSDGAYVKLLRLLHKDQDMRSSLDDGTLFIIPGFEWKAANSTLRKPPLGQSTILRLNQFDLVRPMRMPNLRGKAQLINYALWSENEDGSFYPTSFQYGAEPFVLAKKEGLPRFWPAFRGPWHSRQAWFEEADAKGCKLAVLRELFMFRVTEPAFLPNIEDLAQDEYTTFEQAEEEYKSFQRLLPDRYQTHFSVVTVEYFSSDAYEECVENATSVSDTERKLLCEWERFKSSSHHRQQIPYAIRGSHNVTSGDISLVAQGSVDRLDRLRNNAQLWEGPISVAIYIKHRSEIEKAFNFYKMYSDDIENVTFHFFFENIVSSRDKLYPHNYLRNCALNFSDSEYIINLDVDFVPSKDAYRGLVDLIRNDKNVRDALQNKTMMVLPAFENSYEVEEDDISTSQIPLEKTELLAQLFSRVEPFHLKKFSPGHGPTNFGKWLAHQTGTTYKIAYEESFEPYVLAKRKGLPWFWHQFRGFGKNKLSWLADAHISGYKFAVLRDYFVFHVGKSSINQEISLMTQYEYDAFLSFLSVKANDLKSSDDVYRLLL